MISVRKNIHKTLNEKLEAIKKATVTMVKGQQMTSADDLSTGFQNSGIPVRMFNDSTGHLFKNMTYNKSQEAGNAYYVKKSNACYEQSQTYNVHEWSSVLTLKSGDILMGGKARLQGTLETMGIIQYTSPDGTTNERVQQWRGQGNCVIDLLPAPSEILQMATSPDEKILYLLASVGNPSLLDNPSTLILALNMNNGQPITTFGGVSGILNRSKSIKKTSPLRKSNGLGPGKAWISVDDWVCYQLSRDQTDSL